MIKNPAA
ncbi:hypothetical protein VCHE40_0492A, partial [Vibrio cholerae HE-40]